ncbi:hypothetical protein CMI47_17985 [Candidatus Pacearchaeota archaeon]|nr:hypothetical protein [Candidatus Pacearchaeota archaeon]|tara:strand:- start:1666 stop:1998 length:333 start_codon:yes stop_codon:yes gene_type:complete
MGLEALGDAGIGIVAAVLIVREVLNFLKAREAPIQASEDGECDEAIGRLVRMEEQMSALASSTSEIATLMLRVDADGLPLVYFPRSLSAAISELGKSVERLSSKVDRLHR